MTTADDDPHDHCACACGRDHPVRALYFGTYDREHPRNINAIAAMSAVGIDVTERSARVRRPAGCWAL